VVTRGTTLVAAMAAASVATSATVLVLTGRTGDPLPVQAVNLTVIAAAAAFIATLLHHRMPDNRLWKPLLAVAALGALAVALFAAVRKDADPQPVAVAALWLVDVPLAVSWMLFIGLFPDGHRPFRRWPVLVAVLTSLLLAASVVAWLAMPAAGFFPVPGHFPAVSTRGDASGHPVYAVAAGAASLLVGLLPVAAAGSLVYRYGRAGPVMRQQIRVGAAGLVTSVVLEVLLRAVSGVDHRPAQLMIALVAVGIGQLAVAAALLRWRLWIVDQAFPRAVVLSACSALFTALLVVGAQAVTGRVGSSQLQAAVLAAVVVTVLVQGYSRRLEPAVRRLIYGERPGGFAVLAGLVEGLTSLDDTAAAARITEAARRGLGAPWAALWTPTARDQLFRLLSVSGHAAPASVLSFPAGAGPLSPVTRLFGPGESRGPLPEDAAAVSLLYADEKPWGLLAVGQRRGEPLTIGDEELLSVIARDASLARANRRLHGKVAESHEQLRSRAEQLMESRKRLVAAQDEERRRIERDLHDGAQHDLIVIATRLQRMADAGGPEPAELRDVAELAEHAVFRLQDLARGIYPSVLTDRGVAAALRSVAGGLPMDVTIDLDRITARGRWSADLELAMYFVAVEALTNSQKHSGATRVWVTLAERDGNLVLEIRDDGGGFDTAAAARGSGLQHMSDRVAALGGELVVDSRAGGGTWITARAPTQLPRQRADAEPVKPALTDQARTPSGTAGRPAPGG
jgi:signal transduction histidine kinase